MQGFVQLFLKKKKKKGFIQLKLLSFKIKIAYSILKKKLKESFTIEKSIIIIIIINDAQKICRLAMGLWLLGRPEKKEKQNQR